MFSDAPAAQIETTTILFFLIATVIKHKGKLTEEISQKKAR